MIFEKLPENCPLSDSYDDKTNQGTWILNINDFISSNSSFKRMSRLDYNQIIFVRSLKATMKTQPQNSIQQRMREILTKLKGFSSQLSNAADFEEYSLSLDSLDKLICELSSKQTKDQEEKKDAAKEIKVKTRQLKQVRKDFDTFKRERETADQDFEHQIVTQKNTISELKRKLKTCRESKEFHQYQKLKDEKEELQKLVDKEEAEIMTLSQEKKKMVSLAEFDSLQTELSEIKRSYSEMSNWERKFNALAIENRVNITELETLRLTNKHLNSVIQNQKQEIQNDIEFISCLLDEDEKASLNSSQTCESTNDYQLEDIDVTRAKKKKKSKKHRHKYESRCKTQIQTIQEEPEMTEIEPEEEVTHRHHHRSSECEVKSVKSFSIVMFILAGVLAVPIPGWNC